MSFGLLSIPAVLLGIAAIAAVLFALQWLRVQHREVEVQTTLFWQVAMEESRARVFTQRFRHLPAWLLLVAIASLLWLLFGRPELASEDNTRHIVLLNWTQQNDSVRRVELKQAIVTADRLPTAKREVIAVGEHMETLLAADEPTTLISLRADAAVPAPANEIDWALEALAGTASSRQPIAVHLVGNTQVDARRLQALTVPGAFIVTRVRTDADANDPTISMRTLGVSESFEGQFDSVDVWLDFASSSGEAVDAGRIAITASDRLIAQPLLVSKTGRMELRGLSADGSTLTVSVDGETIGELTLPQRNLIRVAIGAGVPSTVRELVELDPACTVVSDNADVMLGSDPVTCGFCFTASGDETAAFSLTSGVDSDPESVLPAIIDALALKQIDATGLAEQSGRVIQVDVQAGPRRQVAVWSDLFEAGFNFRESRACPVFVSRTIRWLSNKPPIVEWAAVGERLPQAGPDFTRVTSESAVTTDGQVLATTSLAKPAFEPADLAVSDLTSATGGSTVFAVFGILAIVLLTAEWILYQRGSMP